jgi:hypothetical protein
LSELNGLACSEVELALVFNDHRLNHLIILTINSIGVGLQQSLGGNEVDVSVVGGFHC